jgi:SAM-dependent methyltransferase
MPSVTENQRNWSVDWDWSQRGDEWSEWWGGTRALWYGAVFPRIQAMVPTGRILEIAPGYGRCTQFLKDLGEELVVVDMTQSCIDHCRERFKTSSSISYHVNDGRSLSMVEDGTIDFAFSFDSLVHVDAGVIDGYVSQLADKLSADGVGFIHHSNAGALTAVSRATRRLPARLYEPLRRRGLAMNLTAWRDESMSAAQFREQCARAGLSCIGQELVSWEYGGYLIDSFSLFTRRGSHWDRPLKLVRNPLFVAEARRMAGLYSAASFD